MLLEQLLLESMLSKSLLKSLVTRAAWSSFGVTSFRAHCRQSASEGFQRERVFREFTVGFDVGANDSDVRLAFIHTVRIHAVPSWVRLPFGSKQITEIFLAAFEWERERERESVSGVKTVNVFSEPWMKYVQCTFNVRSMYVCVRVFRLSLAWSVCCLSNYRALFRASTMFILSASWSFSASSAWSFGFGRGRWFITGGFF